MTAPTSFPTMPRTASSISSALPRGRYLGGDPAPQAAFDTPHSDAVIRLRCSQ